MIYDLELLDSLIDRCDTAASSAGGRAGLPHWIESHTRHPKNAQKAWSFKGHEFQIGILEDQAPHIAVQKCAQVGISEILARTALGLLAKLNGETGIYVLPSSTFASKFTTTRLDPIIRSSPRLSTQVSKTVNSTEVKQIGNSFLFIGGAQKESQAISIPARILLRDEYSFGNPDILSVYQSRLGHNLEEDRIIYDFSTPLYPEMGISDLFEQGTQHHYLCYHATCGKWALLDSLTDIVLPGFDDELSSLDRRDLKDSRVHPEKAYVLCPRCHTPVSQENLAAPTHRAWVARHPDRNIHSYHVDPLAAASFKSAPQIISDIRLYRSTARWVQYGIGQPFESADSQIVEASLQKAFRTRRQPPGVAQVTGAVAGMDVGKLSYLVNGKVIGGVLEIFNMETVRQGGDNELGDTFIDRYRGYNSLRGVIDGEPDVSVVKYVQSRTAPNGVWGSYFVRSAHKSSLDLYELKELEGVVNARRTMVIDEFVSDFNAGKIHLPKGLRFEKEICEHLKRPKRIVDEDKLGVEAAVWVSKPPDHWFFSLLYCWLAARMLADGVSTLAPISAGKMVTTVSIKRQ